jgi:hypothetical protein
MIAGPACHLRVRPLKTQLGQIKFRNENVNHPNRIIAGYVVFQVAGEESVLCAFLALHETVHPDIPTKAVL